MTRIPKSWLIYSLEKTYPVLGMVLGGVTQAQAEQLKDGPDGWTILEIVCHVRDYQEIFMERVQRMLQEDRPTLKPYDAVAREALITQNRYAEQNMKAVYEDYVRTRLAFIELLNNTDSEHLTRPGINPLTGEIDVSVSVFHTIMHDSDHTEQIARVRGMTLL